MERLLTPRETAEIMAVAPRTVKEWLRRGDLAGVKVRNLWRIRRSDLERFIRTENLNRRDPSQSRFSEKMGEPFKE